MKLFTFILLLSFSALTLTENYDTVLPPTEKDEKNLGAGKIKKEFNVKVNDADSIRVDVYFQKEHEKHSERLERIVRLTLKFLNEKIGKYPDDEITLVERFRTDANKNDVNENEISFDSDFILADKSFEFEISVASKISALYFGRTVKPSTKDDEWLSLGISRFIAHKIVSKYYSPQLNTFHLVGFLPIYGIAFLSYNGIPIIYTLRYFNVPLESASLKKYYEFSNAVPITGKNGDVINEAELEVKNLHKPYLFMLSLDRSIGEEKTFAMLSNFYNDNLFSSVDKNRFEEYLSEISSENDNLKSNYRSLLHKSDKYDYAVDSLVNKGDNEYLLIVSRKEAGKFPVEIFVYAEEDTLKFNWNGKGVHKKIIFKTENKAVAAELDPEHKNILDLNYANNSFMLSTDYTTSVSVAIRWFFWIQNAIIIIGSVG